MPQGSCGASKAVSEINLADQLMQFSMGLNESYDHVRNQILMMDPLPTVSKAYSMILRVQKQKEINAGSSNPFPDMAMQVKFNGPKPSQKKKGPTDKREEKNTASTNRVLSAIEEEESAQNDIVEQANSQIIKTELHRFLRREAPEMAGSINENYEDFSNGSKH
ncbi:UNVERIFIED_CONTAM: hypothetical protein Sradi_2977700 [Sesamum radiatum]|uniref:Uncharacterized protein n=1 Tax=Sesamum radiatum TaxID=300843 RepID=A0AAW2S184_SESRA